MTNTELIQKIRAEIERLKVDYLNRSYTFVPVAMVHLLDFLDTLESEKPMQEGLEEEIGAYFKDWYVDESDQGYSLKTPTGSAVMGHMKNVARHFAQWGAEHLKK